jgi:hypothetical protein
MHNPDIVRHLQGVDDAESIPSMLQRQFQHAGPQAGQRLRNVRVPALQGKILKIFFGPFDP